MPKLQQWIIIILLAALFWQGSGHRREMEQLSNRFHSLLADVRLELSDLRYELRRAQQEAAWYSRPQVEFAGSDEAESVAYLTMTWTFKELAPQAQVQLDYQVAAGDWQEAEVEHVSGLTYRAMLAVPVTHSTMPYSAQFRSAEGAEGSVTVEKQGVEGPGSVTYVISAAVGEQGQSGGLEIFALEAVTGIFQLQVAEEESAEALYVHVARRYYQSEPHWDNVSSIAVLALGPDGSEQAYLTLDSVDRQEWHGVLKVQTRDMATVMTQVTFRDGTVAEISLDAPWTAP